MTLGDRWIRFEGKRMVLGPGESALDALRARGIEIAFSCERGVCQACLLQAMSGDPGPEALLGLPAPLREAGCFLPCRTTAPSRLDAVRPDPASLVREAVVAAKTRLGANVLQLSLEPLSACDWRPGQTVELLNPAGEARAYSIVSLMRDYFLEIHLARRGGAVSGWADGALAEGDIVRFRGPFGAFAYDRGLDGRPLLLIGTGSGGGAVLGIARDAVAQNHRGPVRLFHGARHAVGLHLRAPLAALSGEGVETVCRASRETTGDLPAARALDLAFADEPDLSEAAVFLCGAPAMVEAGRALAERHGAAPALVFTDVFTPRLSSVSPAGA